MRKSVITAAIGFSLTCYTLYSCNGNSGPQLATKEDSLRFAQSVMSKYPGEAATSILQDTVPPARGRDFQKPTGMEPISWATVKEYSDAYDKSHPLKSPEGYYYRGYTIDSASYATLMKQPAIKGLFLRLGKKPDGSYTIMLLGLDEKGALITTGVARDSVGGDDDSNFDHLSPCPADCP